MSRKTCIIAVGILAGTLTSGAVQALPVAVSGAHPSERADILTMAMDRLASLFAWGHARPDHRSDARPNSTPASMLEKEGGALDPNGHH